MTSDKINRNDPCPCGSGKKYKKCCEAKEAKNRQVHREMSRGGPFGALKNLGSAGAAAGLQNLSNRLIKQISHIKIPEAPVELTPSDHAPQESYANDPTLEIPRGGIDASAMMAAEMIQYIFPKPQENSHSKPAPEQ